MKKKERVTLLLDSDIIAYQVSFVNQQEFDFGFEEKLRTIDEEKAHAQAVDVVENLIVKLRADAVVVCLTDKVNWRKGVLPTYKDNRKGVAKPELLTSVKDHLATSYESFIRPGLEADDVMGILSTHPSLIPGKKIIVSEDKDMKTIPGYLFNPRKDKAPWYVDEPQANWWHMYQTICGDTTDGYKGCPGVGPKGAERLLGDNIEDDWWSAIVKLFESKGLTEADALVQARVARICRATDYNFKTKEVILWKP